MRTRYAMEVACSREHLWSFFEDLEKLPLWIPGFVDIEVEGDLKAPEGSTYVMRVKEGARIVAYEGRNLVWRRGERIAEEIRGGRFEPGQVLHAEHRFSDAGKGCRLEYEQRFEARGLGFTLMKPVLWLVGKLFVRHMFRRLKRAAEASA